MMSDVPQKQPSPRADLLEVGEAPAAHHQPEARRHPKPRGVGQLNLTAMLDVCFQLLIFFVLTANFAVGEGVLPAELPVGQGAASDDADPPQTPITVLLRSLGPEQVHVEIQGQPIGLTPAELYAALWQRQRRADNPQGIFTPEDPVIIHPERMVPWGAVVDVYNQAVRAQYLNINFAQPQN